MPSLFLSQNARQFLAWTGAEATNAHGSSGTYCLAAKAAITPNCP